MAQPDDHGYEEEGVPQGLPDDYLSDLLVEDSEVVPQARLEESEVVPQALPDDYLSDLLSPEEIRMDWVDRAEEQLYRTEGRAERALDTALYGEDGQEVLVRPYDLKEFYGRGVPTTPAREDVEGVEGITEEHRMSLPTDEELAAWPSPEGTEVIGDDVQFHQTFTPPEKTFRDPTILTTVFDILETPQRAILSPAFAAYADDQEGMPSVEAIWEELKNSVKLPSHQRGKVAHDAMWLYRQFGKDMGWDMDSWMHTAGQIGFSIITDPTTFFGIGAARKAATTLATEQTAELLTKKMSRELDNEAVQSLVKKHLSKQGVTGSMSDEQTASAMRQITRHIIEDAPLEKQTIEAATPRIREFIAENIGDAAAKEFDELAPHLGRGGLHVGVPFMKKKELVTAQNLSKAFSPAKKVVSKLGAPVADYITSAASLVSPRVALGLNRALGGNLDYYQQAAHIRGESDALLRAGLDELAEFADVGVAGSKRGQELLEAEPEKLLAEVTKGVGPTQEARTWASVALNLPYRQGSMRLRDISAGGILPVAKSDLSHNTLRIIHKAYSEGVITAAQKENTIDDGLEVLYEKFFGDGVSNVEGLDVDQVADLIAAAKDTMSKDAKSYNTLQKKVGDKVLAMAEYNKALMGDMLKKENAYIQSKAVQAAKDAVSDARASGVKDKNFLKKVGADAEARVLAKETESYPNYFYHFIQNKSDIRVRQLMDPATTAGKTQKHREILDIAENVKAGHNPADDILLSMSGRMYAHVRMMARRKMDDLLFEDPHKRWAVSAAGKKKSSFPANEWSILSHPTTGREYFVRRDVHEAWKRALKFNEPGVLEKAFRQYDHILGRWKAYATHGRPMFYNMRNMIDDSFRMFMGGYNFSKTTNDQAQQIGMLGKLLRKEKTKPFRLRVKGEDRSKFHKFYKNSADDIEAKYTKDLEKLSEETITNKGGQTASLGDLYDAALRLGVIDKGFVSADLAADIPRHLEAGKLFDRKDMVAKFFNPASKKHALLGQQGHYLTLTGNIAKNLENSRRLKLFLDSWKRGETFAEAAKNTKKWLFDYSELTDFERQFMRRLMPFYTFMRKNIPSQVEGMIRHPGRYLSVGKAKKGIEQKAEDKYGPIGAVRDYMDDLGAIRLPLKTKYNSPVFWNPGLSMTDINVFGAFVPKMKMGRDELWDRFTPALSIPEMGVLQRDPRTGLSMKGRYIEASPWESYLARASGVPVKKKTNLNTGESYEVVSESFAKALRKLFPHFVAYGRALGLSDRINPFEEEQATLRKIRELTGQSLLVNNPLKAEIEFYRQSLEGPLAEAAAIREGEILEPTE